MEIRVRKEEGYQSKRYTVLQFKGKFQSDIENQEKSGLHLGRLQQSQPGKYKLEIGVMDLLGHSQKVEPHMLYTQTVNGQEQNEKIVLVKGIVTNKIVFDKRPVPEMERAEVVTEPNRLCNIFKRKTPRS